MVTTNMLHSTFSKSNRIIKEKVKESFVLVLYYNHSYIRRCHRLLPLLDFLFPAKSYLSSKYEANWSLAVEYVHLSVARGEKN